MRWIGAFNIGYGGLGLAAAAYLGRIDGALLCLWVMASGMAMRSAPFTRATARVRRAVSRAWRRALD